MYILGDIGNTETKIFLVSKKNKILKRINFISKKINNNQLKILFNKNNIQINIIEKILGFKIKKKFLKNNRIGDHIWYISNMKKFKNHYPKWKQTYSTNKIIKELIDKLIKNN